MAEYVVNMACYRGRFYAVVTKRVSTRRVEFIAETELYVHVDDATAEALAYCQEYKLEPVRLEERQA